MTVPSPHDHIDHAEIASIQERLQSSSDRLGGLVRRVADARQIRDYDTDRRKKALAMAMTSFLDSGESAAAADAKGRASFQYAEEMKGLAAQLRAAELAIAEWEAARIAWETARSLLSTAKELSRM